MYEFVAYRVGEHVFVYNRIILSCNNLCIYTFQFTLKFYLKISHSMASIILSNSSQNIRKFDGRLTEEKSKHNYEPNPNSRARRIGIFKNLPLLQMMLLYM
jgi:hypothetical protein